MCPAGRWAPVMPHVIPSKVLVEALPAPLFQGIPSPLFIQPPQSSRANFEGEGLGGAPGWGSGARILTQSFPAVSLQFALEGLVENRWNSLPLGPEDILLYFLFKAAAGFFGHRGLSSSRSRLACAVCGRARGSSRSWGC